MKTTKDYLNEILSYYDYSSDNYIEDIEERDREIKEQLEKLEERRSNRTLEEMIIDKIIELVDWLKQERNEEEYYYTPSEMWSIMQEATDFSQKERGVSNKTAEKILKDYYSDYDDFVEDYRFNNAYVKALDNAIVYEAEDILNFNLNTSDFIKEAEQLLNDYNRGYDVFDK